MDTQLSFSFLAPAEDLPAPLPTVANIKSSQGADILDERPGIMSAKVVRVDGHFAVKYGRSIEFVECQNMVFVAKSTSIRVPKLYAMFTEDSTDLKFIVMEYIPAKTLRSCWKNLDHDQRQRITTQLRDWFDELRSLPCPKPDYFGSIDGSGLRHAFFGGVDKFKTFCGPYESEEAVIRDLVDKARWSRRECDSTYETGNFLEAAMREVFRGHKAVFTHGDFHRANVLLQDDGGLVIIDWAWSGWYPSFWEYCHAVCVDLAFKDDWHVWISKFLDCCYPEFGYYYWLYEITYM